ncbi:hypothetical protein KFK09_003035 [Dendrobium nobile]|uniref:Uncharacterized protein n=1 Tax=Dendrobium nobile TaxID=94219 RepID=A0A8T3C3B2_DENNO|nr:hypothetical protein KFK09_003035 [Dendrobium nobile]
MEMLQDKFGVFYQMTHTDSFDQRVFIKHLNFLMMSELSVLGSLDSSHRATIFNYKHVIFG